MVRDVLAGSGLPVLARRNHGVAELIGADGTGCFLGDRVAEWGRALARLATDDATRQQIGAEAQRRALEFDWGSVGARLEALMRDLAGPTVTSATA